MVAATAVSTPYASRALPTPVELPPIAVSLVGDKIALGEEARTRLMWEAFPFFMSQLRDDKGDRLIMGEHHEEWAEEMQWCPLLCLLAPRDHGKTWTVIAYLAWRAWRHNRDPFTGALMEDLPEGQFLAVIFSETLDQAKEFFSQFQSLLVANEDLFADVLPDFRRGKAATIRSVWSRTRVRLKSRFDVSIRAYRTSTRGLHPNLIICDDVLSEKNSQTAYQRGKTWTYFIGTLMPMNAEQYIVVGTAQHYDDLLHRLKPDPKKPPLIIRNRKVRFRWLKYRAVDWDTKIVLWPARHSLADLEGRRAQDPIIFSREMQNDPRDDASSLFPFTLTNPAIQRGANLVFLQEYRKPAEELVILGMDIAMSESVGADYTVVGVASLNRYTMHRRWLWAHRERGMSFEQQVNLLRFACSVFDVDIGVIEDNGFQKWLHTETEKYPETAGRLVGHRTGREKADWREGVPSFVLSLQQNLWTLPSGDAESLAFAREWQSELNAFGWKDDKLQGVGSHDDIVMCQWFLERAARQAQEWLTHPDPDAEPVVPMEDVGIERVAIQRDY